MGQRRTTIVVVGDSKGLENGDEILLIPAFRSRNGWAMTDEQCTDLRRLGQFIDRWEMAPTD
jgi:hypothetical protein